MLFWTFHLLKNAKEYHSFPKNIKQLFSTLKNKKFLERKISILKSFLKDHVTEDWSNAALPTQE